MSKNNIFWIQLIVFANLVFFCRGAPLALVGLFVTLTLLQISLLTKDYYEQKRSDLSLIEMNKKIDDIYKVVERLSSKAFMKDMMK